MGYPEKKLYSEEEYLELERKSTVKHEYFQGEIRILVRNDDSHSEMKNMSGASKVHNEISSNCIFELKSKLKGKPCRPYGSDFRVNIPDLTLYTYPDISVICNEPNLTDSEKDTFTNPTVIFEILSPSTRNYDLGGKFLLYKQIETLKEYILIDSEAIKVIKYSKNEDNSWLMTEINTLNEMLKLNSVQVELQLIDIYDNVKFV
jgi:Uma2 family endonuclease